MTHIWFVQLIGNGAVLPTVRDSDGSVRAAVEARLGFKCALYHPNRTSKSQHPVVGVNTEGRGASGGV